MGFSIGGGLIFLGVGAAAQPGLLGVIGCMVGWACGSAGAIYVSAAARIKRLERRLADAEAGKAV
jgi:hypothetical protein